MLNLQWLKHLRPMLDESSCTTLALGLVISHLDYANSILCELPARDLNRMQRVQNATAKLILGVDKYASTTHCLRTLHWLPIKARIEHKILSLVYKALHDRGPQYLRDLLQECLPMRQGLRSSTEFKPLVVPRTRLKTFTARSFLVQGPLAWNRLPSDIKQSETLELFKKKTKTLLFNHYLGAQ